MELRKLLKIIPINQYSSENTTKYLQEMSFKEVPVWKKYQNPMLKWNMKHHSSHLWMNFSFDTNVINAGIVTTNLLCIVFFRTTKSKPELFILVQICEQWILHVNHSIPPHVWHAPPCVLRLVTRKRGPTIQSCARISSCWGWCNTLVWNSKMCFYLCFQILLIVH